MEHSMHMTQTEVMWSDVKSSLTDADGNVVIPHDMIVVLDESTPPLGTLAIHGTLKASDTADVTLTADNVLIFGALEVGNEDTPHTRDFEIVLTGEASDPDVVLADWAPDHGGTGHMGGAHANHMTNPIDNKALIVAPGGTIDLHGADTKSWTQLDGTVEAGATSIKVLDADGWQVGDTITIAPTGLDAFEVEDRVITGINGDTITFDEPLEHQHYGAQQNLGDGKVLDMRAEVANLSRNITIRGEEDPDLQMVATQSAHEETATGRVGYGGHVIVLDNTEVRIDGAEFTELGITGEIGRYPLHFHHAGDMTGSYVEDVSIHHTLQRGIVVHQTDNLLIKDSVVYDVMSHGIYIEDGVETGNRFEGNLVMLPRTTPNGFRVDEANINLTVREAGEKASGFWITNVENEFVGNHVAGIPTGQGFWFIQPDIDTSHVSRSDPRTKDNNLLQFEDNTAHTIMVDENIGFLFGYSPIWTGVGLDIQLDLGDNGADINGFTAWQVANMAVASVNQTVDFNDLMAADVRKFVHTATDDFGVTEVTNAVYVVKSDNMPDDVDLYEYYLSGVNEGPQLSHGSTGIDFIGLNIIGQEYLHTAIDRPEDMGNVRFLVGDNGNGDYDFRDLSVDYREYVPEELERGEAFFAYGGNDEVRGTNRDDILVGGDGNDRLGGYGGADTLIGGAGDDTLSRKMAGGISATRDDLYMGGTGDDTIELGNKSSDERNTLLFRKGDGDDYVTGFDTEGRTHDTIALVGYRESDLDADGDGDFDNADLNLIRTDLDVSRFNKDVVLDLGDGDSITLHMAKHKDNLDAGEFSFIPNASRADARIKQALELDAIDGSINSNTPPPPPPPSDDEGAGDTPPPPPPPDVEDPPVADASDIDALIQQVIAEFDGDGDTISIEAGDGTTLGTANGDLIIGDAGNNRIWSRNGDDVVIGGEGKDRISTGRGEDVLIGGADKDLLTGKKGSDIFVFGLGSDKDVVRDFDASEGDSFDVSTAGFGSFDTLLANAVDGNNRVKINAEDGSTLVIKKVAVEDLQEAWFDLG